VTVQCFPLFHKVIMYGVPGIMRMRNYGMVPGIMEYADNDQTLCHAGQRVRYDLNGKSFPLATDVFHVDLAVLDESIDHGALV